MPLVPPEPPLPTPPLVPPEPVVGDLHMPSVEPAIAQVRPSPQSLGNWQRSFRPCLQPAMPPNNVPARANANKPVHRR